MVTDMLVFLQLSTMNDALGEAETPLEATY